MKITIENPSCKGEDLLLHIFFTSASKSKLLQSKLQSDVRLLLEYYREKDVVVLVTKSVILVQFSLSADGKVTNESKLMLGWKISCESKGLFPNAT